MPKVILIETCGDCPRHNQYSTLRGESWIKQTLVCKVQTDPDSPPPDDCPLLDLEAVLAKVKADHAYWHIDTEHKPFASGAEAMAKALKGGGESDS